MNLFDTPISAHFLTGNQSRLDASWRKDSTSDPFSRLYWVKSGTGFVRHHGREFILRPGHAYLIPIRSECAFGCAKQVEIWWVHVTLELWGGLDPFSWIPCRYELKNAEAEPLFPHSIPRLLALAAISAPAARLETAGLILQLVAPFFQYPEDTNATAVAPSLPMRRFLPVLEYIERHLTANTPLPQLAALIHLQPAYFSHRFATLFGLPPVAWRNRRRVERSLPLLLQTDRTLEDIAHVVGFANAFHFSGIFKRFMGNSPDQFRRQKQKP